MSEKLERPLSSRYRINLIWASIGFGLFYWILESIREAILLEETHLLDRLFRPGSFGFWMRLLVVLILILFGVFAHTHRRRIETPSAREKYLVSRRPHVVLTGLAFCLFYWILESLRDSLLFEDTTFFHHLFSPDSMVFWMRLMAVCVMLLFSVYAQQMIDSAKRMAIELREANRRLSELDRMKSDFLSIVSHELRTPIAIMREGVSLCLEERVGPLNELQRKLLTDTKQSIDRLNRLVTDLLDLSRIEEGRLRLHRRRIDLVKVVQEVCQGYLIQTRKKGILLKLEATVKSIPFYADGDKITQIFNNLLSNALRFTPEGGHITVCIQDEEQSVRCAVQDDGIGIAEENLPKLFNKFQQFGRVDGPGYKGTGLGLAITKALVEKHGGRIWAESRLGKGTTIHFTLPKAPMPELLIVDDEQPVIDLICAFLEEDGYRFVGARDGMEALQIAVERRPSVILLDMKLPGMNGYELLGRLKNDVRTHHIPVIIISAFEVDRRRLQSSGEDLSAFPVIHKPFERETLRMVVQEALSQ